MTALLAILSLGFLIVVHEGGHYFVARLCKMRIERFSIGFGPGILKRKSKKTGTTFQIAPIPFGGFVEIRGMNIAEDVDPDDKFAYPNRPAWQRFVTIFAGPATNYISAMVLAFALFTCRGIDSPYKFYDVAAVREDFDAHGKLEVGDRIMAVDGVPLLAAGVYQPKNGPVMKADSLVKRVNAKDGQAVTLTIVRAGKQLDVTIQPKPGKDKDGNNLLDPETKKTVYQLGIVPFDQPEVLDVGVIDAAKESVTYPVVVAGRIIKGIHEILTGKEEADPGGPKRIYDEFARAWSHGADTGMTLLIVLSVYLALFNLFPLPALDGGRLVFLSYELITRRRANPKIEAMVHMGGIMVLGVVMILVTLRDCHVI
ncbi:MAG: site-2 protease family protein [Kofleriaceae bacterium]|nr:site-2 protease family protein [Kofleriaceae bacterium]